MKAFVRFTPYRILIWFAFFAAGAVPVARALSRVISDTDTGVMLNEEGREFPPPVLTHP
jgi:hypothetical protein